MMHAADTITGTDQGGTSPGGNLSTLGITTAHPIATINMMVINPILGAG